MKFGVWGLFRERLELFRAMDALFRAVFGSDLPPRRGLLSLKRGVLPPTRA